LSLEGGRSKGLNAREGESQTSVIGLGFPIESPLERQRLIQGAKNWGGSKKAEPKGKTPVEAPLDYIKKEAFLYIPHTLRVWCVCCLSLYIILFFMLSSGWCWNNPFDPM
jgi:hypothetical protein